MLDIQRPSAISGLDNLTPGDVVLFDEPSPFRDAEQPPEPCPFLVFDLHNLKNNRFVILAAESPFQSSARCPFDIYVNRAFAIRAAGLSSPTSFNLHHRIIVVDDHEGYCLQTDGTAVTGKLASAEQAQLQAFRTPERIEANLQSCKWAMKHFLPRRRSISDARRKVIAPAPYSLPEQPQPSAEI
ncbi:hypothetical protein [Cohaesibacter intestini]|uniref:hypothetical protein n=1 Tax=Cohaesibacter intestini TaxID=2211145 RepID=UPI000DEB6759|nr:hypothetical protein [Cohaesibacter intestini]